ncbi:MAG: sulfatase [Bryobacterales bacterium]|nr:sulfatase [Bryobacterales bacterium]
MRTRRDFLWASAAVGALTTAGCSKQQDEAPKPPNILFVIADDWSYPHAGAYGDQGVKTPAFDRVAREGVLFTNSFCASPSCTPSRSAVLSGRPIYNCKEAGVLYGSLPKDLPLFTHALEDGGYFVGYTGKGWSPGAPKALGMDRSPTGKAFQSKQHTGEIRRGLDKRDYAANFADFLAERPAGKPFFFWLGGTEPHREYAKGAGLSIGKKLSDAKVPAQWPDVEVIQSDILDYYSEVEWLDQQVAKALAALEKTGDLENTIVVVTSDNGMPFPRAKVNLYDAGTHMPLAIRWGKRAPGGRVVEDFVSHTDFAATFLEVAGLPRLSGSTGKSLVPLLTSPLSGQIDPKRDHAVTALERHTMCRPDGATYPIRALRTRDFLYIRNFEPDRWPTGGPDFVSSNKTTHGDVDAAPIKEFFLDPSNQAQYKDLYELGFGKRPAEELYNVRSDPDQVKNLAGSAVANATLARYRDRLDNILRGDGDPRIEGKDPWQAYIYHQTTGYGASMNRSATPQEREKAAGAGPHKPE